MDILKAFAIGALLLVAACANTVQAGLNHFNGGDFEKAYDVWLPLASAGDAAAQHNMGVLWESGLSTRTPKNLATASAYFTLAARQNFLPSMVPLANIQLASGHNDVAISWLNLAARWNDQAAISRLAGMGVAPPAPDLAQQSQDRSMVQGQALGLFACVLISGGAGCAR